MESYTKFRIYFWLKIHCQKGKVLKEIFFGYFAHIPWNSNNFSLSSPHVFSTFGLKFCKKPYDGEQACDRRETCEKSDWHIKKATKRRKWIESIASRLLHGVKGEGWRVNGAQSANPKRVTKGRGRRSERCKDVKTGQGEKKGDGMVYKGLVFINP